MKIKIRIHSIIFIFFPFVIGISSFYLSAVHVPRICPQGARICSLDTLACISLAKLANQEYEQLSERVALVALEKLCNEVSPKRSPQDVLLNGLAQKIAYRVVPDPRKRKVVISPEEILESRVTMYVFSRAMTAAKQERGMRCSPIDSCFTTLDMAVKRAEKEPFGLRVVIVGFYAPFISQCAILLRDKNPLLTFIEQRFSRYTMATMVDYLELEGSISPTTLINTLRRVMLSRNKSSVNTLEYLVSRFHLNSEYLRVALGSARPKQAEVVAYLNRKGIATVLAVPAAQPPRSTRTDF